MSQPLLNLVGFIFLFSCCFASEQSEFISQQQVSTPSCSPGYNHSVSTPQAIKCMEVPALELPASTIQLSMSELVCIQENARPKTPEVNRNIDVRVHSKLFNKNPSVGLPVYQAHIEMFNVQTQEQLQKIKNFKNNSFEFETSDLLFNMIQTLISSNSLLKNITKDILHERMHSQVQEENLKEGMQTMIALAKMGFAIDINYFLFFFEQYEALENQEPIYSGKLRSFECDIIDVIKNLSDKNLQNWCDYLLQDGVRQCLLNCFFVDHFEMLNDLKGKTFIECLDDLCQIKKYRRENYSIIEMMLISYAIDRSLL